MVMANESGTRKLTAAHVVLVKRDESEKVVPVFDTYIRYAPGVVVNYNTRFSRVAPWMLKDGMSKETAVSIIKRMIKGHVLVIFSGKNVLDALGITESQLRKYVTDYVDLQGYFFKRVNGQPYGLGPLVEYYGYKENGKRVVIHKELAKDAEYALRIYIDHYDPVSFFFPEFFGSSTYIMTSKEYARLYKLY